LLLDIADLYALAGDVAAAREVLGQIRSQATSDDAQILVNRLAAVQNDLRDYQSLIGTACQLPAWQGGELVSGIAVRLADDGEFQSALEVASLIQDGNSRSLTLKYIGKAQAAAGRLAEAQNTAVAIAAIPDRDFNAETEVLTAIALNQATGDRNAAETTMSTAMQTALKLPPDAGFDMRPRADALGKVAVAWAQIGSAQKSLEIVSQIGNEKEQDSLLLDAALAAAKAHKAGAARMLLDKVHDHTSAVYVGALVSAATSLGDFTAAQRALEQFSEDCDGTATLAADLATAMARSGRIASAMELIRRIPGYAEPSLLGAKAYGLRQVAATEAESGQFDMARATAASIPSVLAEPQHPRTFQCKFVGGMVSPDVAKTDWRTVTNSALVRYSIVTAYRSTARVMAARGGVNDAIAWSKKEREPYAQASILLGAAEGILGRSASVPSI
jgi:hypothetical protein